MTDDRLDRLVRDADPYRVRDLDGADQELLEEIMSTPDVVRKRRRLLVPLATAAAVTGVVAAGAVLARERSTTEYAAPLPNISIAAPAADAWEFALKAAEENPRLLITEPGWKITSVYGFADESGDIFFENGKRSLNITWYPAKYYQSYYTDRLAVSKPQPSAIGDWAGDVFTYGDSDFALLLHARDGSFAELRTSDNWTRAGFDALLTKIQRVDATTFIAAMPPEIVTPARAAEAANKVLADVPMPPNFDTGRLLTFGTNDPYQFGAQVTAQVGCAWIAEWERADRVGDTTARAKAAKAMRSSHDWKVLRSMVDEGDWAEGFWRMADKVAAGKVTPDFRKSLDCD
ncbi:hypothetical protein [Actinoplanes siamensis]|uniref:Uncharacterized protein n=1 Tax=Actinoplanes siamensis TaxID=1223317 RepID=A0A919N699_9ACTN|nr:hypothetical protein [Actinoplanes siamensis]GIF05141.1 hypothetical protein Asi03nite_26790 [Actinoplanes siamensis]